MQVSYLLGVKSPEFRGKNSLGSALVLCCRGSFFFSPSDRGRKSDNFLARKDGGDKGQAAGHQFEPRSRNGSRVTGRVLSPEPSEQSPCLPGVPRARWEDAEGPTKAFSQRLGELCLFSSYSWPLSTRLFVAAQGTSGRAGALRGLGWGVPLPGPTSFMTSKLGGRNYRRHQNV